MYLCQQPRQVRLISITTKGKLTFDFKVRIGLCMSGQADVKELREILSSDTGIELNRMLLTEIDDQGFLRTHSGSLIVKSIFLKVNT